MGNYVSQFSHYLESYFTTKEIKVVMFGLGETGKTWILYKLIWNKSVKTIPTIGFSVERFQYENIHFNLFDIGWEGGKLSPLWRDHYYDTHALIFVVDSSVQESIWLPSAREELLKLLAESAYLNCPMLIYANKQDLPNIFNGEDIAEILGLNEWKLQNPHRAIHVQECSAITGDGLYDGLEWIYNQLVDTKTVPTCSKTMTV